MEKKTIKKYSSTNVYTQTLNLWANTKYYLNKYLKNSVDQFVIHYPLPFENMFNYQGTSQSVCELVYKSEAQVE